MTAEAIAVVKGTVGATAIVSLQTDDDLGERGLRWTTVWSLAMRAGLVAERVPIRDFDKRDLLAHIDPAVAAVEALLATGHRVYVHCTAGLNRSPTVCIAHLTRQPAFGNVEAALAHVLARHPDAVPYLDVLAKWAKAAKRAAQR